MTTTAIDARSILAFAIAASTLWSAGCSRRVDEIRASDPSVVDNLPSPAPDPRDWPWWRGIDHNGATDQTGPTQWVVGDDPSDNVVFQTRLPGRGHASPCVWGDQIFISTADEEQEVMSLHCYQGLVGTERWSCELFRGDFMRRHASNTQASATPACDGRRVFVAQMVGDAIRLAAVDMDGQRLWTVRVAPFKSEHGYGSSPLIWKSLVIVAGDSSAGSFLAAVHRESGELVWRTRRTSGSSYQSPTLAVLKGRAQVLIGGRRKVASFDPNDGELLWFSTGPANTMANTLAVGGDRIVASGGYPQKGVWCLDAKGNVIWKQRYKLYVPSPLISGPRVYVAGDDGVLRCLSLKDGETLWSKRLSGAVTASPVRAGSHVYVATEKGDVYVLEDADTYRQAARNTVPEGLFATPVLARGRLFLRGTKTLYCIAAPQQADSPKPPLQPALQ